MRKSLIAVALLLLASAGTAFAGTATGNMTVNATVVADCVINNVGTLTFGNLGIPFTINNQNAPGTTNINYTCTNTGVNATIRLDQGANANTGSSDAAPLRRMSDGKATPNYISYGLFSDTGHSAVWNNTTGVSVAADGAAHDVTVYGLATAANVPAGAYSDKVVITVAF